MNTELRSMLVKAEGRYLDAKEVEALRSYASGMPARLAAARRMQAAEDRVVSRAMALLGDEKKAHGNRTEAFDEMRLMLRRIALAHVREDKRHFMDVHGEWIAEQLVIWVEPAVLVSAFEKLGKAIEEVLADADARAFMPYLQAFIEELEQWARKS